MTTRVECTIIAPWCIRSLEPCLVNHWLSAILRLCPLLANVISVMTSTEFYFHGFPNPALSFTPSCECHGGLHVKHRGISAFPESRPQMPVSDILIKSCSLSCCRRPKAWASASSFYCKSSNATQTGTVLHLSRSLRTVLC